MNYIIGRNEPLSILKDEVFQDFVQSLHRQDNLTCPSYSNLIKMLDFDYLSHKSSLISMLDKAEYVAISMDGWSHQRKSYMGFVIYWFNEDLTKNIVTLGCKKCIGKKDSIKVAKSIHSVLDEYGVTNKCVGVNTDGGSEYQKSFHTMFSNGR